MKSNSGFEEARELQYFEFLGKFVWKRKEREWSICKTSFSIGRLYHVSPGCGERYCLRTLLIYVKGPINFEDICTINGVLNPTFKDACNLMSFLDDVQEYIDGILEASF